MDVIVMEKVKKLVHNHEESLMFELSQLQEEHELVTADSMRAALKQFKASDPEI